MRVRNGDSERSAFLGIPTQRRLDFLKPLEQPVALSFECGPAVLQFRGAQPAAELQQGPARHRRLDQPLVAGLPALVLVERDD